MKISSKIDAVTIFVRGAEVVRIAELELPQGETQLTFTGLPLDLDKDSLRVEGHADGDLELGTVDVRRVHVSADEGGQDHGPRRLLEKRIEKLEGEALGLEGRLASARTRRKMMQGLANMPSGKGAARGTKTDWAAIYDLLGERLPEVQGEIVTLKIERREIDKKIEDLQGQLEDEIVPADWRVDVVLDATAKSALKGQLVLRYQIISAGWKPLYEARLKTSLEEEGGQIDLVRNAQIHQQSGEAWEDVEVTLSTTRPAGGTRAPELHSHVLDILPPEPSMQAFHMRAGASLDLAEAMPVEACHAAAAPEPTRKRRSFKPREADVEQAMFQVRFKVPGRITLAGRGEAKKVRIASQKLVPRLQVRATPLLDPTAYLYADFKLDGELALLPGKVALYRDNTYVGTGQLPLVNVEERHEMGFGADDRVVIKRAEKKRAKGSHGLIKTENTDEFMFKVTVQNHHKQAMPVRILERIPVSNHEKLKVERLREMSDPTIEDVDDRRGVLAFEEDVAAGDVYVIKLHYRLSWPKDERIG